MVMIGMTGALHSFTPTILVVVVDHRGTILNELSYPEFRSRDFMGKNFGLERKGEAGLG
jgi:hypothetical protein